MSAKTHRRGFTIVELMMVIGIIGILLGIVTTAAASSIKQARARKAAACCNIVEQGLAAFYAQKGYWPGSIGARIRSGSLSARSNTEGADNYSDSDKYVLDSSEIDSMITDLINMSRQGNPCMDISGLFVSRSQGEAGTRALGMDFMDAIRGTKQSKKKMRVAEMHFGYPETSHGYFRRFKVVYSIPSDEMKVSQQ